MLLKVVLHGYLAKFHDGPILIEGTTAAEVVEGVTRQLPGFKPHPTTGRHKIKIVGYETRESLYEPLDPDTVEIHIVPQLNGGKNGGLLQIILGVALVAVGFFIGAGTMMGSLLMKVGALALLGGLTQLLSPQPESDKNDQTKSQYLGTPKNTVAIGTRIPILYGTDRVYGQFLAFDINAIEYN